MMKQLKSTTLPQLLLLFMVIGLLQSCSDFLEHEPGTQISITEQLKSKQGVLTALNGLYSELEANVREERFAVYADLQGGNLKFSPSLSANSKGQITVPSTTKKLYSFEDDADASNFSRFYSQSYDIINQTNLLLEFTDALTDATDAEKNEIKAQALTIRAYTHFLLNTVYSQNYGFTPDASHKGIVYNTQSITKGIQYPARETAANTYTLLIKDIDEALNLYSDTTLLSGPAYSFFNKTSAKALLARIYLSKKDWNNAYKMADEVIAQSGVSLTNSEDYISQWEQPDLPISEILLELSVPRGSDGTTGGSLAKSFGYTSASSYSTYVASEDLINLYENNDLRKQLFLQKNIETVVNLEKVDRNYYFTKKFQDNPGYVAFRLTEMYLIRAEAALGLDTPNFEQAKSDINTIRARAKATLLTDTANLEDVIFEERRKELCFEGHLFFDIARNKKHIVRNEGCIATICGLSYPSAKYVIPIPRSTIDLNPNLKQNESY